MYSESHLAFDLIANSNCPRVSRTELFIKFFRIAMLAFPMYISTLQALLTFSFDLRHRYSQNTFLRSASPSAYATGPQLLGRRFISSDTSQILTRAILYLSSFLSHVSRPTVIGSNQRWRSLNFLLYLSKPIRVLPE